MKRVHILILIVVIAAIGVVMSLSMNSSTYAGFAEAIERPGREFHVIGKLSPGKPIEFDAMKDANSFTFYMLDNNGKEMKVKYTDSKPQDFEKLDQLVVIGKMKDGQFEAHKMNLKCPSKYNNDEVPEGFKEKDFTGSSN
ncbi:MAG: cytochrome c maturation protein CcmE [Lentimicrobiaceae bacterium]|nr:cytochrome c maturation protein CcmE [Lentimicrobiaceae bacterium]